MNINFLTQRKRDFQSVFNSEEGERVLAHIYKMCGMNTQTHVPGDSHSTSFNAGKHRVGQGIQSIMAQNEEDISKILKLSGEGSSGSTYNPFNQK